ncbi:hypothetical protein KFK09_023282 [Dendrobium nobile]|uniref:Uncharacterized protein n=1 Tax=Dendrobium nobile TaxID=94219 RepID=A0A8T3AKA0_DENNO|nr:hypothetical protein KFK09_023282 [Dendrobium nobile]
MKENNKKYDNLTTSQASLNLLSWKLLELNGMGVTLPWALIFEQPRGIFLYFLDYFLWPKNFGHFESCFSFFNVIYSPIIASIFLGITKNFYFSLILTFPNSIVIIIFYRVALA